ncbi:hypothetical protein ACTQ34_17480, partial [Agathobaculum sp. LCP25S3_E8]|uniref:hypothetical protein n=1 Tax=Agathobaculum sp. LCP25S3_E8 TaxID=3438735 RepID=UPI003F913836
GDGILLQSLPKRRQYVVADEVRSLAGKSADASKSTSELIEGSAVSVQAGMKILEPFRDCNHRDRLEVRQLPQ